MAEQQEQDSAHRIVVIGGGILGTATALAASRCGAAVTLVTAGRIADGASGRSLSWLNSAGIRSPEYHRLRMLGLDRYRTFAARNDASGYLRFDGGLTWAGSDRSLVSVFDHELSIGYDAEWLGADEVARWTPGVEASAIAAEGAIFNPGEGWVDLPSLVGELIRQFTARGGRLLQGVGHADVVIRGDRVAAVRFADGTSLEADAVLLATGAAVPADLRRLGVVIGEQSPTALLVRTKPVETALTAVLNTPRVAVRPTPSGALALDSGWSERALMIDEDGTVTIPDGVVDGLLTEASRVLAGNPLLTVDEIGVGPKPIPADGEPVLGAIVDVPGLHVAFTHSGATLGLIVGELLGREIVSGRASPLLDTFRQSRFTDRVPADQSAGE